MYDMTESGIRSIAWAEAYIGIYPSCVDIDLLNRLERLIMFDVSLDFVANALGTIKQEVEEVIV